MIYFAVFADDRWAGGHIVVVAFGKIRDVFGEDVCDAVDGVGGRESVRGAGGGHAGGRGEAPAARREGGGRPRGGVRARALANVRRGESPGVARHDGHVVKVLKSFDKQ